MEIIRNDFSFTITGFTSSNKYQYEEYTRNDGHGPRTYNVGEKKVPSVTTILSATQSPEKKASLDRWRARVGYAEAAKITQASAARGTEMHYVLEQYVKGIGYLNISEKGHEARMMAHQIIQDILGPLTIVYGSEVSLAYDDRWAGSTDLVADYKGGTNIVDFKQSNRPKTDEYVEDYKLQLAAYALAHEKQYGPIDGALIAMCTPKLVSQKWELNKSELNEYKDKWLKRVEMYEKNLSQKPQD